MADGFTRPTLTTSAEPGLLNPEVAQRSGCFDNDFPIPQYRLLGTSGCGLFAGADGNHVSDPQLLRFQLERCNAGSVVSICSCVGDATQSAPHNHVTRGLNQRTGIHVAEHHHVAAVLQMIAGPQRYLMHAGANRLR